MFFKSKTLQAMDLYGELTIASLLTEKVIEIRKECKTPIAKTCFSEIYASEDKDEMRVAIAKAIAAEQQQSLFNKGSGNTVFLLFFFYAITK